MIYEDYLSFTKNREEKKRLTKSKKDNILELLGLFMLTSICNSKYTQLKEVNKTIESSYSELSTLSESIEGKTYQ